MLPRRGPALFTPWRSNCCALLYCCLVLACVLLSPTSSADADANTTHAAASPTLIPSTPTPTTANKTPTSPTSANTTSLSFSSSPSSCDPRYETWNATSQQCNCQSGFSGLGCQMCTQSTDCQRVFQSPAMTCATGLAYHNQSDHKTYDCDLDASLEALFSDGALAVHCNRTRTNHNCSVAVFKRHETVYSDHVIDCVLSDCDFPSGGNGDGNCALIECKCGKACSAFTKAIVEQSLSGKPAKITVANATSLSIDIEGSPLPLAATCRASACENDPSGGSGSGSGGGGGGGESIWSSPIFLALVISGSLALLVLVGVCCGSCCVSSRLGKALTIAQIDREIAALTATSGRMLEFTRVNCRVVDPKTKETKRILSDLSGYAQRGQVLGLLGPSGSGKTSLLNALAAVENGKCQLTGEVAVDGKKIGRNYRRVAAYVQQDDALFSTLSVRECLQYSAALRLPASVPEIVKREMVSRILRELNLSHVEHARIGSSGASAGRGISGGERRRVSIGMELVTSPQILFLDEPTSGLDSSSANSVVQLVKELASHGRIVVLSIHQPSTKAFMLLDQIVLLAKGKMLYHGSPQRAKRHFEAVGFKCPVNENVADFILDIASDVKNIPMVRAAFKAKHGDKTPLKAVPLTPGTPAEDFQPERTTELSYVSTRSGASESSPFMDAEGDGLDTPRLHEMLGMPGTPGTPTSLRSPPSSPPGLGSPERIQLPSSIGATSPHSTTPFKRSLWIEMRVLFQRTALNIFRHRSLLFLQLTLSITLALFGGLIFNHVTNDLAGFQNRSGAFYFILTFFGFASMSSMDLFIAERGIFLRETGAMYYGAFSYFMAKAVLDTLLLRVLPAAMFASIFYWIMGLQATIGRFLLFQTTLVLFNVAAGSISILVGVLARNVGTANLSATVVFLVMLLFGGFLLNSQTMPTSVAWLKHFSIFSYAFEILMTNELKGLLMTFDAPGYPSVPVYGDVFLKTLGMDYANRYYDLAALVIIAGALQVLAFLFLSLQVPVRQELIEEESDDGDTYKGRSSTMQVDVDEVKLADLKKRPAVKAAEETGDETEGEEHGEDGDVV